MGWERCRFSPLAVAVRTRGILLTYESSGQKQSQPGTLKSSLYFPTSSSYTLCLKGSPSFPNSTTMQQRSRVQMKEPTGRHFTFTSWQTAPSAFLSAPDNNSSLGHLVSARLPLAPGASGTPVDIRIKFIFVQLCLVKCVSLGFYELHTWSTHPWFCLWLWNSHCPSVIWKTVKKKKKNTPSIFAATESFSQNSAMIFFLMSSRDGLKQTQGMHSKLGSHPRHKIAVITSGRGKGHERTNSIRPSHNAAPTLHTGL